MVRWEWESDKGWRPLLGADAKTVEAAWKLRDTAPVARLSLGKLDYDIDFGAMTQQNVVSKKTRNLRRVAPPRKPEPPAAKTGPRTKFPPLAARWEWERGKGKWEPFSYRDSAALEKAFGRDDLKTTLVLKGPRIKQGLLLEVHFGHMKQTNTETGTKHSVRRVLLSPAEAAAEAAEAASMAAKAAAAAKASASPPAVRRAPPAAAAAAAAAAAEADTEPESDAGEAPRRGLPKAPPLKRRRK
eukprot:TRINITY_DN30763_c0_g1_i1.p1 TRINITY_DN30763_c0_g1~~TRINITY_DN30763_c0_g1_i1.p1  ORF type:complete len:268 (+),score=86.30 TRINITY_DN30763_c0_g1_i1:77-805(+)